MTQLAEPFDHNLLVTSAFKDAKQSFEAWAAIGPGELPNDPIDAMQVQLMRWQRSKFGDQTDERMALGVIEEISECRLASNGVDAFDALGDVMVFAGQLATNNRLALGSILHLAAIIDEANSHSARMIVESQGVLAQVALKGAQKVRGFDHVETYQRRLVGALAHCIAGCGMVAVVAKIEEIEDDDEIDDAKTSIDYGQIYIEVGTEVLKRSAGHDAIPKLVVH